jgi:hypothetical protein
MAKQIDVGYAMLDDDLIDVNGRRCGKVDDLEFRGGPGEETYLSAILSGSGVWPRRLPRRFRGIARRVFGEETWGKNIARVPIEAIDHMESAVHLREPARELGLGQGDDWSEQIVRKIPGS